MRQIKGQMAFEKSFWGRFSLENTSIVRINCNLRSDIKNGNFIPKVLIMLEHPSYFCKDI